MRTSAALLALVTAVACAPARGGSSPDGGSDNDNNPPGSSDPNQIHHAADGLCEWQPVALGTLTAESYCEAYARAFCNQAGRCCAMEQASAEVCVHFAIAEFCALQLPDRIHAGLVRVDLQHAQMCLDDIPNDGCRLKPNPRCIDQSSTFVFTPASTSVCLESYDCVTGLCSRGAATCGGTCAAGRAVGESCEYGIECDPRVAFCDATSTCAPIKSAGESCDGWDCAAGLFCVGGTCQGPVAAGQPCTPNADACAEGYSCAGTCIFDHTLAEGAQCWDGDQCVSGTYCQKTSPMGDGAGLCTHYAAPGESCDELLTRADHIHAACINGVAVALKDEGASCSDPEECMLGLSCDAGSCIAPAGVGDPCLSEKCLMFDACDQSANKCVTQRLPLGAVCRHPPDCESGVCLHDACAPKRADGVECGYDYECASGACDREFGCRAKCPL